MPLQITEKGIKAMPPVNAVQAVVYKGHTLGVIYESRAGACIEVLRTHSRHLATTNHSDIIHFVKEDEYRNATLADFNEYRVCHSECYLID